MRTRKQLLHEQTRCAQRIQKTLEEANIKLDSVISDIMGLSGRRMIEAIIAGVRNPQRLAQWADRRIKASPKALYDALHGRVTDHHRACGLAPRPSGEVSRLTQRDREDAHLAIRDAQSEEQRRAGAASPGPRPLRFPHSFQASKAENSPCPLEQTSVSLAALELRHTSSMSARILVG